MRRPVILLAVVALTTPLLFFGCAGSDGSNGAPGAPGANGTPGTPGAPGTAAAAIDNIHGQAALAADILATENKFLVTVNITSATADASGVATVHFTVMNGATPVATGIDNISAGIFKLAPAGGGLTYNRWVPYIYRSGRAVNAGYRENNYSSTPRGTLVNNGGGNYTYTFGTNLATATFLWPIDNVSLVGYDRSLTHRVSVYFGGHSGPTGEGDFDFVPNGSAVTQTRNIVQTATCKKCHGPGFDGHGGDRVTVEGCNGCHSPNSYMVNTSANGGTTESIAMQDMIHKIHAGRELPSSTGPDGQFYDNPNTPADETADNYHIGTTPYAYTVGSLTATWRTAAFPAVLANCRACHTGTGANVDNWKSVPSRSACGSCHDTINWATGTNHGGGSATSDANCASCHPNAGLISWPIYPVPASHDWTKMDIRNISEFDIAVTTDTPSRGYYVNGESPVISIVLTDNTGATISPSSVVEDPSAEGCIPVVGAEGTQCTVANDGLFTAANVYVTGPRAQRIPVLSYAARTALRAAGAGKGPWDVSGASFKLRVIVDSGIPMITYNTAIAYEGYGADELISGDIVCRNAATANAQDNAFFFSFFANRAAATVPEIVAWLNAIPQFQERAIAYIEENSVDPGLDNLLANTGKLAIRSRGIAENTLSAAGDVQVKRNMAQPNIRVAEDSAGIFGVNAFAAAGGAAQARKRATLRNTDPKVSFSDTTAIKYYLDNVDNLAPGTYVINVEFADRGRGPGNPAEPPYVDYRTPSVAVATFNVKTADTKAFPGNVEKPIAAGCEVCHWSDAGTGFVLDFPRHHKNVNAQAVDQCGGCHMYKSAMNPVATAYSVADFGTKPLSRRVHAFHDGSQLNYPTITVGHEETAAFGRNWRITYPMDIRNCESCHPAGATSGTWKTNPNRLACMGCHDSDAATTHMDAMTYDPTPMVPWSGDEQESCKACH